MNEAKPEPQPQPQPQPTPKPGGGWYAPKWKHSRLTVAALAVVVLAMLGCRGAVTTPPTPEPEPPAPEPAAAFSLIGTWTFTDADNLVQTLTFTKTRWINHYTKRADDGSIEEMWTESGAWSVSSSDPRGRSGTVTREWLDDEQDPPAVVTVDKLFARGADDDELLMHPWDLGEPEEAADAMVNYTRVTDPLPDLVGTWTWRPVEGAVTRAAILTINADGTFTWDLVRDDSTRTFVGEWELNVANYTVALTEMTFTNTPVDGEPETSDFVPDPPWLFGFAPSDVATTIVLSSPWLEMSGNFP